MATIYRGNELLYQEKSRILGSSDLVELKVYFERIGGRWEAVVYNKIGQRLSGNVQISGPKKYEEICWAIIRTVGHSDWSAQLLSKM